MRHDAVSVECSVQKIVVLPYSGSSEEDVVILSMIRRRRDDRYLVNQHSSNCGCCTELWEKGIQSSTRKHCVRTRHADDVYYHLLLG